MPLDSRVWGFKAGGERMTTAQLTLCVKHGLQIVRDKQAPAGDCHPKAQWFGEKGIVQECDARNGTTPKILEYFTQLEKEANP